MNRTESKSRHSKGFALVAALSLMILMTLLAVGLLSLSVISLRASGRNEAFAEARANARLAMMIALGELQKEMGPDMRVSAEAALFDQNPQTEAVDGLAQSRWLAAYDYWGDWLNSSYTRPAGGGSLTISDTYTARREKMFRRWLLSMPENMVDDINAPDTLNTWNDQNSVILVGKGSLGDSAVTHPDRVTRAYLTRIGKTGRNAWWIGPESHRAKVNLDEEPQSLSSQEWEVAQGNTKEVAVGAIDGLEALDGKPELRKRILTTATVQPAGVSAKAAKDSFFDLTAHSRGVLASVRTGHLRKDLSLLFENDRSDLPPQYNYQSGANQEPSIRPMSADLLSRNPKITERHFQSWTNMRYFYRMYRQDVGPSRGTGSPDSLEWSGSTPQAKAQIPLLYRDASKANQWQGDDSYLRMPILSKLTFIYSLLAEQISPTDPRYRLLLVYTPVYTYWNPFNTELRIPDNTMGCLSSTYQVLPMRTQFYLGNNLQTANTGSLFTGNAHSFLRSGNGDPFIVFKPGEFKLFSHATIGPQTGGQNAPLDLIPGFNPLAYGGDRVQIGPPRPASDNPGVMVQFSHSESSGNVSYGNTPGSLCHTPFWLLDPSRRGDAYQWNYPVMYQNDWFNLAQTYTPMTPDPLPMGGVATKPQNILRWAFDGGLTQVGFAQLVIKGLSQFDHDSISWKKDWRSRNWIQSPPFYFGNSLYISEDQKTAHTQRLDNPYVMNFGPLRGAADLIRVVSHLGENAYLGSGVQPFEKVTSVPALELPTAPSGSLAAFSTMRINPGWSKPGAMNSDLHVETVGGHNTSKASYANSVNKIIAYQSGVTGPGIGNSFIHPMIPRTDIYKYVNNSISADPADRRYPLDNINYNDNKVFCDYWDHVFLLNDALWDDYFVSSLADQYRPGAGEAASLSRNLERLVAGEDLANSRFVYHSDHRTVAQTKADLEAADGYLKAARHLMVDGTFNVNSTSVAAWHALFTGIRGRQLVYRDSNGSLNPIAIPSGKRIALSRFGTETSDQETSDPAQGAAMPAGSRGWTGVRFLDDDQLRKLAEECVKQVKQRGPFLNFSEFINRRLSNDKLGLKGALQAAIDYDDESPDSGSINGRFKTGPGFMMKASDLGDHAFSTPEAVEGSRFAGIPGYVIQSDLLRPIANTLAVRDDTFRIRAYGEALDSGGEKVLARAWCEVIVQRNPEFSDPKNEPSVPAREMSAQGAFSDNAALTAANRLFGRKFRIESFRWLTGAEI